MYAAPYVHPEGFGSVGYLEHIHEDSVTVADPIFGTITVSPDDCFGVIHTETGSVLPAVRPILIRTPTSDQLARSEERLVANDGEVLMLKPRHFEGDEFPSGYPHAWKLIRRWREGAALDWRTIALSAIFARTSIQRPIEEAEALFRTFGPTIRDAMLRGRPPTEDQLVRLRGIRGTRAVSKKKGGAFSWDDVPAFVDIFDWAPWVAELASGSSDYTRGFRNAVALEWAPRGLGIAKISFMMLIGRDASCMDTRMQRFFFGEYEEEETQFAFGALEDEVLTASRERFRFEKRTGKRSKRPGARGMLQSAVAHYAALEDRLKETPYFDPEWPMPYAKAQWMLWETLGRTATTANHGALWEVMGPLIRDVDTGRV